jgi:predicted Zn-dependent protease
MKLKNVLYSLATVLFFGCCTHANTPQKALPPEQLAPETVYLTIHIDKSMTQEQKISVRAAIAEWETAVHSIVSSTVLEDWSNEEEMAGPTIEGDQMICTRQVYIAGLKNTHSLTQIIDEKVNTKTGQVLGYTNSKCASKWIVLFVDRSEKEKFKTVMLHEFGHLIGMQHLPIVGTIMYPSVDLGTNCITPIDLAQFCSMWKCNPENMVSSCKSN